MVVAKSIPEKHHRTQKSPTVSDLIRQIPTNEFNHGFISWCERILQPSTVGPGTSIAQGISIADVSGKKHLKVPAWHKAHVRTPDVENRNRILLQSGFTLILPNARDRNRLGQINLVVDKPRKQHRHAKPPKSRAAYAALINTKKPTTHMGQRMACLGAVKLGCPHNPFSGLIGTTTKHEKAKKSLRVWLGATKQSEARWTCVPGGCSSFARGPACSTAEPEKLTSLQKLLGLFSSPTRSSSRDVSIRVPFFL